MIFLRKYRFAKIALSFLSCSGHPVLSVLSSQFDFDLSTSTCLGCPNPVVLYLMSCHGCLVPGPPPPGCPTPDVLSQLSCPGCSVPAVLSRLFCPSCRVPAVLSRVSFFGLKKVICFNFLAFLFPLSYPGCSLPAPAFLSVPTVLALCHIRTVLLAVLSRLTRALPM